MINGIKRFFEGQLHLRQGKALYRQERWAEAAAEYQAALALGRDSAIVHYNLGLALYKNNQKTEAREHWTRMRELAEGNNPYLFEQAEIMLRQFG